MNKKTLLFIFLLCVLAFPLFAQAADFGDILTKIKDLLLLIASSIVVIGWVIAGILYLTAAGSPEKTKLAKQALIAAVIGTILVVLANIDIYTTIKDALGV